MSEAGFCLPSTLRPQPPPSPSFRSRNARELPKRLPAMADRRLTVPSLGERAAESAVEEDRVVAKSSSTAWRSCDQPFDGPRPRTGSVVSATATAQTNRAVGRAFPPRSNGLRSARISAVTTRRRRNAPTARLAHRQGRRFRAESPRASRHTPQSAGNHKRLLPRILAKRRARLLRRINGGWSASVWTSTGRSASSGRISRSFPRLVVAMSVSRIRWRSRSLATCQAYHGRRESKSNQISINFDFFRVSLGMSDAALIASCVEWREWAGCSGSSSNIRRSSSTRAISPSRSRDR